ncbi:MAG: DUF3881 family protein [Cellulosilyticaceae bacterium]
MESPLKAIGFSELDESYRIDEIISDILNKPTEQKATKAAESEIVAEYIKQFGDKTYVMVRVIVDRKQKEPKIQVQHCEAYVDATHMVELEELEIECIDEDYSYYAICEEKETGMQFIFWMQNVVEYLEETKENKVPIGVKTVALALEGTIVLPIEKDEEDEQVEREERDKLRLILQKMREGDEEAKEILEKEEKELDNQLKERLREEDFLTIMSGYFIPTTLVDATYAVLGDIKKIDLRKNTKTKESFYVFELEVNDMPLEVAVNAKTLIGVPSVGMRFMGTCWMQGTVVMG